jgi:hypothetical protein
MRADGVTKFEDVGEVTVVYSVEYPSSCWKILMDAGEIFMYSIEGPQKSESDVQHEAIPKCVRLWSYLRLLILSCLRSMCYFRPSVLQSSSPPVLCSQEAVPNMIWRGRFWAQESSGRILWTSGLMRRHICCSEQRFYLCWHRLNLDCRSFPFSLPLTEGHRRDLQGTGLARDCVWSLPNASQRRRTVCAPLTCFARPWSWDVACGSSG